MGKRNNNNKKAYVKHVGYDFKLENVQKQTSLWFDVLKIQKKK